jgi:acetolactate synthase-1/2/3 large subunit
VLQLAELPEAPVVPLRSGRGIVSDEHHLGFTCASGFKRWRDTDALIAIGTRLELLWFRWPQPPKLAPIISIDIDPTQVPRVKPAVPIVGDSRTATRALIEAVMRSGRRAPRAAGVQALKARTRAEFQKVSRTWPTS